MRCPSCGKENPEGFQFCGFCTAPLEEAAAPAAEERKVVTVLFCDLVGFTARSESADPEDVRARIRPYHQRLRTEIERYGGTVEKFVGDAVMAVFGAPVAHEDDVERAVRSGLRILEAIEELNDADAGLELQVRIGINTGEAVVALGTRPEQGEGIVTGDVVNTASRLQSAAPVGGIAVGELTYRQTKEIFDYEELEPVSVKGKAGPLQIWRARSARARFGTDLTRRHSTPLVGRELEQDLLRGTFERCARDASVQLVTIVGEPGVGKSRVAGELFRHLDDRSDLIISWRQGRCLPYGEGISFWALGEIVKAQAGILESDAPDVAAQKLEAALPADVEEREWLFARLAPLVGAEAEPAPQEESFTAWRRFLESLAAERPAVLVFEDLHWADEALLAFLEHVVEWSQGVPLLLLCTARPELYEAQAAWGAGTRNATTINLAPLSDEETTQLVSALLDAAVLPAEVQALVLERAGGNPLYAEEFVRMLKDRGLLVKKGRTLALAAGAEIPFPESVQALIAARLDTLSAERKRLLQDASVIGKVFWAGAVAELGSREESDVRDGLHELSRKELVRPARTSSMEGESEYAFWHALVRDVCYGQIPRAARGVKHRGAAEWIERRAGERAEDLADVIAHHYSQALELASAAGEPGDAELEAKARRFLVLAGERALALDVARAEASFAKALALAPAGDPERPEILERWAGAATPMGHPAEAAAALEEAVAAFRDRGEPVAAGRALIKLSAARWTLGDPRHEQASLEALALLEAEPPGPELVHAHGTLATLKLVQSADRAAIAAADRTLALAAELGLEEPWALSVRGCARCSMGEAEGLDEMRRALEQVADHKRAHTTAAIHANFAEALWAFEGPEASLAAARAGIDFCERRGIRGQALVSGAMSLGALEQLGEWDEALALADSLVRGSEGSGSTFVLVLARSTQARLLAARGENEQARTHSKWLVETTRASGEAQLIAQAFGAVARVRLAEREREREQAAALLGELERTPNFRQNPFFPAHLPDLVRAALACAEPGLAERLADGIEPRTPLLEHAFCAVRATLAEAAGEHERAVALYAEAAERWERFGVVPERGHALLGRSRCLLALGRLGAESALREARQIFAGLGARPLLEETDVLLERAAAAAS
ncbi:MAG: adenylate/guanylate cyclase domain-containing protein [Gaiellaceae bacterium]